jgi:hypothetical protein
VQRFRNLLSVMNKVAGGLMLIAGAYVAYYGWYEIRVLNGATGDPIVDRAVELQTRLQNTVVPDKPAAFVIRAVVVLAAVALVAAATRRRRTISDPFTDRTSATPLPDPVSTADAVNSSAEDHVTTARR